MRKSQVQIEMSSIAPATTPAAGPRYTIVAQAFHWLTAGLMFVVLPLAWVAVNMPKSAPEQEAVFTLHKSVGLTILIIVAFRLAWRATHPAPPLSSLVARWERVLSTASHWLLYAILFGMPISGYILSAAAGHEITYFGLFTVPGLPKSNSLAHLALILHVITGQWLVYGLILIHLGATAWHVIVHRDGVLERMLPQQMEFTPQEPATVLDGD